MNDNNNYRRRYEAIRYTRLVYNNDQEGKSPLNRLMMNFLFFHFHLSTDSVHANTKTTPFATVVVINDFRPEKIR